MAIEIAVNAQKDQAQQIKFSCGSRFMLLDFAKRVNRF